MIVFYLADHAHLWARFTGFSTSGKVLVGFFALVAVSAAYLAWEFHVAPVVPDPGDAQAIQDADDESVALTRPLCRDDLAPGFTDSQWAELTNGFAADAYTYRSGGGLPGERRITWTREDYRS